LRARCLLDDPGALAPVPALAYTTGPDAGADHDVDDLVDWLLAPQRQWLRELGLAPREWAQLIDDLEASSLGERERVTLLRQALADGAGFSLDHPEDWLARCRGSGRLPPGSGGALEARTLARRCRELEASLAPLGPERQGQVSWQQWQQSVLWRGDTLVLLHPAAARSRHSLALWWQLLLASAGDQRPAAAVLVARGSKGFGVQTRLDPPAQAEARAELQRLAGLRAQWRGRCWPLPPETAWALLDAGESRAISVWEGGPQQRGERDEPEQSLCFGRALSGRELLAAAGDPQAQAAALLGPLLEHSR
jgi:exodeoxyribonuclease V gamma subunit